MVDTPKPTSVNIAVRNLGAEEAPFVYFDGVLAFGMHHGVVQIELATNVLNVCSKDELKNEVIVTAHLRCSPEAARNLQQEIGNALLIGMAVKPTPEGKSN